jgi:hypothetical protein
MTKLPFVVTLVLAVVAMVPVVGCASFQQQPFNKGANGSLKRIAVLDASFPREIRVVNNGSVADGIGLLGEAAAGSAEQNKTDKFSERVWYPLLGSSEEMISLIRAELEKSGYSVIKLSGQHPRQAPEDDDDDGRDYSSITTDADAFLDVSFVRVWYLSPGGSSVYRPWLLVRARLISAQDKSRLYAQEFSYGGDTGTSERHIPSAPRYSYKDFDALMDRADEAKEGLTAGFKPIAMQIAGAIR